MMNSAETEIREMAHQLWIDAGQPEGRDEEFWYQAERQLAERGEIDSSQQAVKARKPPVVPGSTPV